MTLRDMYLAALRRDLDRIAELAARLPDCEIVKLHAGIWVALQRHGSAPEKGSDA